ncbi:hypothetical protein LVD17_22895 [Fulvivirga ulvae]|uniref:hypothetical protein n=1 Tax=Fulvivirga ulvae TaxID=2904245 RepID=UPI001F309190|nr:hypothetical protein [Fulvivirga ulvae]UII31144.1 hypothetical protein LVD17_22895 [Fulvivirga ulvae]
MIKLIRKGLFLTPFVLFFFAADRYGEENTARLENKRTLTTNKTMEVEPGGRLQVIVKGNEKLQPLVLLNNGENNGSSGESDATPVRHILVCHPYAAHGTYVCERIMPSFSLTSLFRNPD